MELLLTGKKKNRVSIFRVKGGFVVKRSGKTIFDTTKLPRWENTWETAVKVFNEEFGENEWNWKLPYKRFVEQISQFYVRPEGKGLREIHIKKENPFAKEELELK